MRKKKLALTFVGAWAVLFLATLVTDPGSLPLWEQVLITGIMACAAPLLYLVSERSDRKGRTLTIHAAGSPEILYRVEGEWICRGMEEKATWYCKGDKIFSFQSRDPLYRVRDNRVYRAGETEPFLTVEGDKVLSCQSGQAVYDIR
ncbi:MAG: hypothetical protein ACI4O5_07270 [Oscillospiraceae bacterium]